MKINYPTLIWYFRISVWNHYLEVLEFPFIPTNVLCKSKSVENKTESSESLHWTLNGTVMKFTDTSICSEIKR